MDGTPTLLAAFGAGVLSIVSPAVVPLLPGFVSYVWNRGPAHIAACLLGFSVVFVALGAGATAVGQTLLEHLAFVEAAAGVALAAIGLRDMRTSRAPDPVIVAFAAGAALMFGWTPVAGVVLNSVLALATSADTIDRGLWLLAVNAAGRALPLAALALSYGLLVRRAAVADVSRRRLQLISGGVVAITGLLISAGLFPRITAALLPLLPLT